MWHLEPPSSALKEWYKNTMIQRLGNRIWSSTLLSVDDKYVLMPNGATDYCILEQLLLGKPQHLFYLTSILMPALIDRYNDSELDDYHKAIHCPIASRTLAQQTLVYKYQNKLNTLLGVFDYQNELSLNKNRSYKLTKDIGKNACVYCNRQYAFTIERGAGSNDKDRLARPALDHWFPKSVYPLLSLSLYNLIPSCTTCNSSAKGDKIFRLTTHVNPYCTTSNSPNWKFDYSVSSKSKWNVELVNMTDAKEEATAEAFCLKEVYQCHAGLELNDLLTIAFVNGGSYIPTLIEEVMHGTGTTSKEEAYRILFGTEMIAEKYDDRPMSKFKKDILDKLGIVL